MPAADATPADCTAFWHAWPADSPMVKARHALIQLLQGTLACCPPYCRSLFFIYAYNHVPETSAIDACDATDSRAWLNFVVVHRNQRETPRLLPCGPRTS